MIDFQSDLCQIHYSRHNSMVRRLQQRGAAKSTRLHYKQYRNLNSCSSHPHEQQQPFRSHGTTPGDAQNREIGYIFSAEHTRKLRR